MYSSLIQQKFIFSLFIHSCCNVNILDSEDRASHRDFCHGVQDMQN